MPSNVGQMCHKNMACGGGEICHPNSHICMYIPSDRGIIPMSSAGKKSNLIAKRTFIIWHFKQNICASLQIRNSLFYTSKLRNSLPSLGMQSQSYLLKDAGIGPQFQKNLGIPIPISFRG